MKSKKNIVSIIITIVIATLIIVTMFVVRDSMAKNKIESKLKLSEEEKNNLNCEQLIEDIKSLEDGHGIKHAKQEENTGSGKVKLVFKYIGNGYTISDVAGGELIQYNFYTNDNKLIYTVQKYVPLESRQEYNERTMKENMPNIIFYATIVAIIVIATGICIIIYKK